MRKSLFLLTLFALFLLKSHAFCNKARTYFCFPWQDKIKIDGNLTEKCWQGKATFTKFYELHLEGDNLVHLPLSTMRVWTVYNDKYLFLAAKIQDPDLIVDNRRKKTNKSWRSLIRGDVFEVYLQPQLAKPTFFEFQINPLNQQWNRRHLAFNYRHYNNNYRWQARIKSGVRYNGSLNKIDQDQGWSLEMAIPFAILYDHQKKPLRIKKGHRCRLALCMYDYAFQYDNGLDKSGRKLIASVKFPVLHFHERQYYDILEFK
jgi:hypothetical protein